MEEFAPLRRLRRGGADHRGDRLRDFPQAPPFERRSGAGAGLSEAPRLPLGEALALGALQGPTEVLPVSSSGHIALLPALLGWSYPQLDPGLRKSFEVALHAGSAAALGGDLRRLRRCRGHAAITLLPTALAGLLGERAIERSLGLPRQVAQAQVIAGAALILADLRSPRRGLNQARSRDALWLGVAGALGLVPGVSRAGASLTAARALGFERRAAAGLAREAALPVIVAAAVLRGSALARAGLPRSLRDAFLAGAIASFVSTAVTRRLLTPAAETRSYAPVGIYRIAFGAVALWRLRSRDMRLNDRHG